LAASFLVAAFFFGAGVVAPGICIPGMCPACCAAAGAESDVSASAVAAKSSLVFKMVSIARSTQQGAPSHRDRVSSAEKEAPPASSATPHLAAGVALMVMPAVHVMARMLLAHLVLAAAFFLFWAGLSHLGIRGGHLGGLNHSRLGRGERCGDKDNHLEIS
jgi:hypothetical protein